MRYQGGCHCGAVRYSAEVDLSNPITCNCSYCSRRGSILAFTPAENFTLEAGADSLTEYRFNTKNIAHLFCSICGMQSFGRATKPDGNEMVAINVRCLEGVEPNTLTTQEYDGRSR